MADIAHTVPAIVTAKDGSTFGFERPGLQVTQFDAGPMRSRDWLGYNLRTYDLDPSLWQSGTTALHQWSAFWHHIGGGSECGYIVEPTSETHRDLVCGGLGDAALTTFPIPVVSPSSVTVFVDGVPQEAAAYTVHAVANLLGSDIYAVPADAGDFVTVNGTDAVVTGVARDGLSCLKITPDGTSSTLRVFPATTGKATVSVGEEYTAIIAVMETKSSARSFQVGIRWYDSGTSLLSSSLASASAATVGNWTIYSHTATAVASSAYALPVIEEANASADAVYFDCFALCPGDYTRWHLPSQSPGLIEFAAAPAAGARITATATGKRVSRCRFEPGSSWRVSSAGHAASRSIRAVEVIEV